MDLYTKTTARRILADMPANRIEICAPDNADRIIGYIWEDTSRFNQNDPTSGSVYTWHLYTPYHPATISVRATAWEATRYVVQVFEFFGYENHLDDPSLLA